MPQFSSGKWVSSGAGSAGGGGPYFSGGGGGRGDGGMGGNDNHLLSDNSPPTGPGPFSREASHLQQSVGHPCAPKKP